MAPHRLEVGEPVEGHEIHSPVEPGEHVVRRIPLEVLLGEAESDPAD